MEKINYFIAGCFDTETCNLGRGTETIAFPICYIYNDLIGADLKNYELGKTQINIYRHEEEFIKVIENVINYGLRIYKTPIICAYNLMFDLQSLMETFSKLYNIEVNAQSSTSVYTLDLYHKLTQYPLLRFWDCFYLDMRGLNALGKIAGVPKALGDWNYDLVRTPETPLTAEEIFYAKRDVEILPAYFKYLLNANQWLKQNMLGVNVLTKTSLVRQMAKKTIANKKIIKENEKKLTLGKAFYTHCLKEFPETFEIYALRKACFRGGFCFTSAKFANEVVYNVASIDANSMHHAQICGHYVPNNFRKVKPNVLQNAFNQATKTKLSYVLENYEKPFNFAFHARVKYTNLRLKKDSLFEKFQIALIPQGKFQLNANVEYSNSESNFEAEKENKLAGWKDTAKNAVFALSKLYKAEEVILHVNEIESFCISLVYDYDKAEVILGESTCNFKLPPDYVTLQSMSLYKQKAEIKKIKNLYKENQPYTEELPLTLPEELANSLKNGTCTEHFLDSYYVSTIKGMFNSIYGTQAQDVLKPNFKCENGEIEIDQNTICTKNNFEDLKPEQTKVLYTYGMRIVGYSRLHLLIALALLYKNFGDKGIPTGGDTDSIKLSCDESITDDLILNALKPIAEASKKAIKKCTQRAKENFPLLADEMFKVGSFEIEECGKKEKTRYNKHYELWNKARVSYDGSHAHVTCAGLSRPENKYNIEKCIDDLMSAGYSFAEVCEMVLGYNVHIQNEICHSLQKNKPEVNEKIQQEITDYRGVTSFVNCHKAIALYSIERVLGETFKQTNFRTLKFLETLGKKPLTFERFICYENEIPKVKIFDENGIKTIMKGQ